VSLRDKILQAEDLDYEDVDVPEWDAKIRVQSPTVRERALLVGEFMDATGKVDLERMYPALLIATVVDPETGEALFTADDMGALGEKNGRVVEGVAKVALRVAGMDTDAIAEGKDDSTLTTNGDT